MIGDPDSLWEIHSWMIGSTTLPAIGAEIDG